MKKETKLLELVIRAIEREGYPMEIERYTLEPENRHTDGMLKIKGIKKEIKFETVKWAANKNFGILIEKAKAMGGNGLLVADYINPNLAERLKEERIQFIDICGNAYINNDKLFIYVKGNKAKGYLNKPNKVAAGTMFNATGLKVVFALLNDRKLVNQTYRVIADRADVALGTITNIFKDLKEQMFLVEVKNERKLIEKERLFKKWVEFYPNKLRDKLFIGEYLAPTPDWWKKIDIEKYRGVLSGEVGGNKLTNYLKPQDTIVYLPQTEKFQLIKDAELKKTREGVYTHQNVVKLYEPFWKIGDAQKYAPVLIIYADLFATENSRNIEVANMIYEDCAVEYFK